MDVLDLDFEEEFDVAACFSAIGHIVRRDQPRLLRRVARALKPGGRFVTVSAQLPPPWHPPLWLALAFNAAMTVRNFVWRPPFVMYYLNFLLPGARRLLEENGFEVEVHPGFCRRYPRYHLVVGSTGTGRRRGEETRQASGEREARSGSLSPG
jgi:SAM-dependent methyltransferase